ncbi:MAG: T9SS type A sorting domain-containing protein [Algoriphagus sp.]|nr:T9SS type A sorting domain-containing protein [Algoriphagus sp.]
MPRNLHMVRWLGVSLLLTLSFVARAQFVEFAPVPSQKYVPNGSDLLGARTQNINQIPFWDDFSTGIDTLKWIVQGGSYTETIGLNAPSIGMILLDGVDGNGKPYSFSIQDQGDSDSLISKPFDLSAIPVIENESLFLSFFWQAGGRAELPDENDRLSLEILNEEGNWVPIWRKQGGDYTNRETFKQEIIKILPQWQHAAFQFRFVSDGRKSGPFDSWLIDYVYLNTKRSESNLTYPDRSLTRINNLRLGDFGAFPQELLEGNQTENWSLIQNEFLNLENRFRAMEYSIQIEETDTGLIIPINSNTPFNPVPNALERRVFQSREFSELAVPTAETILKITTSLTSGDKPLYVVNQGDTTFFESVNYKLNDSVSTLFPLLDFFAYDNGSADYAAGINQRSGMLAVKYDSPEEVFLKGISINFTNPNQIDQAIDIMVWEDLDKDPIFTRQELIAYPAAGEDFLFFSLDTNIRVSGEFYIGFTQFTDDFIHVGLDKSNDQGDKIFYNVAGAWAQNEEVTGSLMIRPHVSIAEPFEESALPQNSFRIYPNPTQGILNVEGKFSQLRIFDSFGREIFPQREFTSQGEIVNFISNKPGIYVLNLVTEAGPESFRILVK